MDRLKSKGVVRGIIEEDGVLLVSFLNHDGYFRIAKGWRTTKLRERIMKAQRDGEEIQITFDRDLNILQVL